MRSLLEFAASSQLPLPPAASAAATTSDVPIDDYIWYLIALVYIACLVISMAVFLVVIICSRCRQDSPNDDSPISPEPQAYFMVVELTPLDVPSKQGLKESALKALPKARYEKAADDDTEDQAECVVCLTEFEEGKWIRKLPQCGHEFHVRCIDKWLRSQASCPSCRTEVVVHSPLSQEGCFDE